MKTRVTVTLPAELGRRARERAAREGTTLSQVVRRELEEFAAEADLIEEAEDARTAREVEARVDAGREQVHDWADVRAELDALPG